MTTVYKVQINYKSGISVIHEFTEFTVTRQGSNIASIKWDTPDQGIFPLVFGIENIESIYQLGSYESKAI